MIFYRRKQNTIFFTRICEGKKNTERMPLFPRQELSYQGNGTHLKLVAKKGQWPLRSGKTAIQRDSAVTSRKSYRKSCYCQPTEKVQ